MYYSITFMCNVQTTLCHTKSTFLNADQYVFLMRVCRTNKQVLSNI